MDITEQIADELISSLSECVGEFYEEGAYQLHPEKARALIQDYLRPKMEEIFTRGYELGSSNNISLPDALVTEFGQDT